MQPDAAVDFDGDIRGLRYTAVYKFGCLLISLARLVVVRCGL